MTKVYVVRHAKTALQEYEETHKREHIELLQTKEGFSSILLILVTHSSPLAIEESMQFGNSTREFATKIEQMWQEKMKKYLAFSPKSEWIEAKKSTHYIHLMEIVKQAIEKVDFLERL